MDGWADGWMAVWMVVQVVTFLTPNQFTVHQCPYESIGSTATRLSVNAASFVCLLLKSFNVLRVHCFNGTLTSFISSWIVARESE